MCPLRHDSLGLRGIVIAFSMPSHKQHLVYCVQRRRCIQRFYLLLKLLPLRELGREAVGCWVAAIDEAEVGCGLIGVSRSPRRWSLVRHVHS